MATDTPKITLSHHLATKVRGWQLVTHLFGFDSYYMGHDMEPDEIVWQKDYDPLTKEAQAMDLLDKFDFAEITKIDDMWCVTIAGSSVQGVGRESLPKSISEAAADATGYIS